MHEKRRLANVALVALSVGLTGLWGCGGSEGITTPSVASAAPAAAASTLSAEIVTAMDQTLQDEYHAESIYLGVLADFGDQRPFANVVHAEQRHSAAIVRLYGNHGLDAPESQWTVDNVPHFDSVTEACTAAVSAEQENVALYDTYLALDLPRDVRNVFENNRAASLERHLPAFQSCSCPTCPGS
jgi:hypothetical protein